MRAFFGHGQRDGLRRVIHRKLEPETVPGARKTATGTAWRALESANQAYVPLSADWRLNERHYGALQVGLDNPCNPDPNPNPDPDH